jgi:pyruvate formate-lyase activating enzyme-like uncharacterized protein
MKQTFKRFLAENVEHEHIKKVFADAGLDVVAINPMKPQSGRNKQDIRIGNAETSEDMDKAIEILKKHGLDKEYGISANTKAGG